MTHTIENNSSSFYILGHGAFRIVGLHAFKDNFIWLLESNDLSGSSSDLVVIDPGDAEPVIDYCCRYGVLPKQIWLTHHHVDHTGGVADLIKWVGLHGESLAVYGPAIENIPNVTHSLHGGEVLALNDGVHVNVLSLPGHTRGHLAYFIPLQAKMNAPALFSGDVLFGLGCGRLFEGTAAQMYASLQEIRQLPPETQIYCAHEYSLLNLPFALAVDPSNKALTIRAEAIRRQRQAGEPTVPLELSEECATNPFLRSDQAAIREASVLSIEAQPIDIFARLREMRDQFKVNQ